MNAYKQGFLDGIRAYAWHKEGGQQVGTTGKTLKDALANVEQTWNYAPPSAPLPAEQLLQRGEALQRILQKCRGSLNTQSLDRFDWMEDLEAIHEIATKAISSAPTDDNTF